MPFPDQVDVSESLESYASLIAELVSEAEEMAASFEELVEDTPSA